MFKGGKIKYCYVFEVKVYNFLESDMKYYFILYKNLIVICWRV